MNISVAVSDIIRDEGTIVIFSGYPLNDVGEPGANKITFACDHRYAQALYDALVAGEVPIAEVPDYQIMGVLS